MQHWEILFIFLVIAFVYSSVGFGGGSSYLAILTLYAFPFQEMKLAALTCNIIVVTGGSIIFIRTNQVNWKKIIPLIVTSVPMAFLGAAIKLEQDTFFIILGTTLIAASVLLWFKNRGNTTADVTPKEPNYLRDGITGGLVGFLSGLVGIGGGIFLSPVLNLMKWDTPKKIAATASVFILVNSVSGIAGQLSAVSDYINFGRIGMLGAAVLMGGQLGSRMGAVRFNQLVVRRVTALLVFVAGTEVLIRHLHIFE
jgi:uncharacterized membrane protein YfcA